MYGRCVKLIIRSNKTAYFSLDVRVVPLFSCWRMIWSAVGMQVSETRISKSVGSSELVVVYHPSRQGSNRAIRKHVFIIHDLSI